MRYRRPILAFVLGAIALTAALGLYAVIVPDFGDLQAKILGTSACVSGASIFVLACAPAWERRLYLPLPLVGASAAVVAFALIVIGLWLEPANDAYWKTMGTALFVAGWGALVCLLALAPLAPRFRWTFFAAAGLSLLLAMLGVAVMWSEPDSEAFGRVVGGVAVLTAAFVVTVPVLSRAGRSGVGTTTMPVGFCPRCGSGLEAQGGEDHSCPECGARFQVRYLG
jgi:hypothetical protein